MCATRIFDTEVFRYWFQSKIKALHSMCSLCSSLCMLLHVDRTFHIGSSAMVCVRYAGVRQQRTLHICSRIWHPKKMKMNFSMCSTKGNRKLRSLILHNIKANDTTLSSMSPVAFLCHRKAMNWFVDILWKTDLLESA